MKKHHTFGCSGRGYLPIVVLVMQLILPSRVSLWALPDGEQVTHGNVTFARSANQLTVTQASDKAIVNYTSFNIGSPETVAFDQPGSSAAILNRVTGAMSSEIAGSLFANGNVYLVNPNGILFTASAEINVGGLVASGLPMANDDFLAGRLFFSGDGGPVINEGRLSGKYISLIGSHIDNRGAIDAQDIVLAAGMHSVVIDEAAGGLIRIVLDGGGEGLDSGSEHLGQVISEGTLLASGADGAAIEIGGYNVHLAGETQGGSIAIRAKESVISDAESLIIANGGDIFIEAQRGGITLGGRGVRSESGGSISLIAKEPIHIRSREDIEFEEGGGSGSGVIITSGSGGVLSLGGTNRLVETLDMVLGGAGTPLVIGPATLEAGSITLEAGTLTSSRVVLDQTAKVRVDKVGVSAQGAVIPQAPFRRGNVEPEALSVVKVAGVDQLVDSLQWGQELTRLESTTREFPWPRRGTSYVQQDLAATLRKALEDAENDSSQ